jgi:hypothetical protein
MINSRLKYIVTLLYFVFINCGCFADLASETVYLTWKQQPDTTMTIQWVTPLKETGTQIFYKTKEKDNWQHQRGNNTPFPGMAHSLLHSVELTDLTPDTAYQFKIDKSDSTDPLFFQTMPKDLNAPIRFVVGGDMYHDGYTTKDMRKTCLEAIKTNPHFALLGGDLAYAFSHTRSAEKPERWIEWLKAWNGCMKTEKGRLIPMIAAIGNHDIFGHFNQTPAEAKVFSSLFPMPGEQIYNVLNFGSYLSVFILDSGHANPIGGKQAEWLKKNLQCHSSSLHRIAIYHVPAYPSIRSFRNLQSGQIRRFWVPLFEKGGIQMVFEHHDHTYKRTIPLTGGKSHPEGIVYVGDGAWGVDNPRKPAKSKPIPYLAKFKSARHFILITLDGNNKEVKTFDDSGIVIDEYTHCVSKDKAK